MTARTGEVWAVRARWLKGDRCTVKVHSVWRTSDCIVVIPLEGNPHSRMIESGDLIERVTGHPAETCDAEARPQ